MRQTSLAQRRVPPRIDIIPTTVPAPVKGWNAITPLATMKPDYAVQLVNWIPRAGWIEPRRGFTEWATDVGAPTDPVETLMAYYGATSQKLFAAAGSAFYDVTNSGAATITTVTGLGDSRWQYCNFENSAGDHYLIACNGVDTAKTFNGTVWADLAVNNVAEADLVQPYPYQGRLFFVEKESSDVWYLATYAVSGDATAIPVGPFLSQGGVVEAIASWTVDTRQQVDDYIAFISSRGQVVVYTGTNPADSTLWTLVGIYDLGRPLGRRCYFKVTGDLAIISVDGVYSMNAMLSTDRSAANRNTITQTIQNAMSTAASLYGNNFGWQLISYPPSSLAILNVPVSENIEQQQFVMNTITGAWCRFEGIDANCWEMLNDDLYFGGNTGTVYLADYGSSDNGAEIECIAQSAFNYFEDRGHNKRFAMIRPTIITDFSVTPGIGIYVDFNKTGFISTASTAMAGPLWDTAIWDDAIWPEEAVADQDWHSISGIGHCASVVCIVNTIDSGSADGIVLQLNSYDITFERGGIV